MTPTGNPPNAIDVDAHILEPPDLWERHIDASWRDRAIRPVPEARNADLWLVRGKLTRLDGDGAHSGTGATADERLRDMRERGIDACLLFPTRGLRWEEETLDAPGLTYAHMRAWNTWIGQYCAAASERLWAVAQVSLLDATAAVSEIKRVAELGARAVVLRLGPVRGRPPSHRSFDPVWAALQDHDLSVALHVLAPQRDLFNWGPPEDNSLFVRAHAPYGVVLGVVDLIVGGVLERFPRLRVATIGIGAMWAPWILRDVEAKVRVPITSPGASRLSPGELFDRNCWVAPRPHENLAELSQMVGESRLLLHSYASQHERWRGGLAGLAPPTQRQLLRENALAFLNVEDPGPIV